MNLLKKIIKSIIISTVSFIFLIDVLFFIFKNESLGKVGFYLWSFSYIFFIAFSIYSLINIFKISFKLKSYISIFSLIFIIFIVLLNTINPRNISNETTLETACSLAHIQKSTDMGFWKTCLFGYPNRQYMLSSLPSRLFGRSLFSLNFGGSLYLIIGLPIFLNGLWQMISHKKIYDYLIGTILVSLFHISSFNFYVFSYEQSIFPFSMMLIALGLLVSYVHRRSNLILFMLWMIAQYIIFSYTPGISVLALLYLALLFISIKRKINLQEISVLVFILLSLIISYKMRNDINVIDPAIRSLNQLTNDLYDAGKHIFFQNKGIPMVSPIIQFIFIFYLLGATFAFFGTENFVVGLWIILVLIFSVISKGYAYYGIDYRLHRSLIIFPALFMIIMSVIKTYSENLIHMEKKILNNLMLVYLVVFITGFFNSHNYISGKPISKHYLLVSWFGLHSKIPNNSLILVDSKLGADYQSLNDSLKYFFPNSESWIINNNCDKHSDIKKQKYLITENIDSNECEEIYSNVKYIGDYGQDKKRIKIYNISM